MPQARRRGRVALALAGGGPFGAIYELGALLALEDSLDGLALDRLDAYVGVSAGGFLAAGLANGIPAREMRRLFIESGEGALAPQLFMRPALREYAKRLGCLPSLAGGAAWRWLRRPFRASPLEGLAALGAAIPTGLFDNEAIHACLEDLFERTGRTNDFRRLRAPLYLVATDLDSGQSVSFGRPGHDHVPISRALQASAALPGLFPPVEIDGRHFVDGALRKTLHASEALQDGARLVICVNPIVPFDARLAARDRPAARSALVAGGLPAVLSQTFRAVIHSRMATGLARYRTQYPRADVVLFQPDADDADVFFANPFGYAGRQRACEHAFARTRANLIARAAKLEPTLARHGIAYRWDRLEDGHRTLPRAYPAPAAPRTLAEVTAQLRDTLHALRQWAGPEGSPRDA